MIKSISYLISPDERKRISPVKGKFILTKNDKYGKIRKTKTFSAAEFVKYVRNRDPFITTLRDEKLRVYRGGDPTDFVIEAISLIEVHDRQHRIAEKQYADPIIPDYTGFPDWGDY